MSTTNSVGITDSGLQIFDDTTGAFTDIALTTPGDLLTYSSGGGGQYAVIPVGADGFVLTADSAQPTGLTWAVGGGGGGITWSVITANTLGMSINNGYIANNGAQAVVFTLPVASSVGDVIEVTALNANGWEVEQLAGQNIRYGNQITTTGVTGGIQSTAIGDSLRMVCAVADTTWVVLSSTGEPNVT